MATQKETNVSKRRIVGEWETNDFEDTGSGVYYVGDENEFGHWRIIRISGSYNIRYANASNNTSYEDYTTAWADRASLTYEEYAS